MSDYKTYTIVVRKDEDIIAEALDLCTDGVQFVWAEDGVTRNALDLGADPTSWDDSIEDTCERLYQKGGASDVYEFVRKCYPDMPWSQCEDCDAETPHRNDTKVCLVCGMHKEI